MTDATNTHAILHALEQRFGPAPGAPRASPPVRRRAEPDGPSGPAWPGPARAPPGPFRNQGGRLSVPVAGSCPFRPRRSDRRFLRAGTNSSLPAGSCQRRPRRRAAPRASGLARTWLDAHARVFAAAPPCTVCRVYVSEQVAA